VVEERHAQTTNDGVNEVIPLLLRLVILFLLIAVACCLGRPAERQIWNDFETEQSFALASGQSGSRIAWAQAPGREGRCLEVTFPGQVDWPFAELKSRQPTDWSQFTLLEAEAYNAGDRPFTVTFEVRDREHKMYKPARRLPPGRWVKFQFPIEWMRTGRDPEGWCGEAIDVALVPSMALVGHRPRSPVKVLFDNFVLVRLAPPPAPQLTARGARDGVLLTWSRTPGAEEYRVFAAPGRRVTPGPTTRLVRLRQTCFVDTSIAPREERSYVVVAAGGLTGPSPPSNPVTARRDPAAQPVLSPRNQYGASRTERRRATGFFRVERIAEQWTLIDPEGYPFYSLGIDVIGTGDTYTRVSGREQKFQQYLSSREDEKFAEAWRPPYGYGPYGLDNKGLVFSPYVYFQIQQRGRDYRAAWREEAKQRLLSWRVNTIGAWGSGDFIESSKLPYVAFAGGSRSPALPGSSFPDVFAPQFQANVDKSAAGAAKRKDDPLLIGWFSDNELDWYGDWQHQKGLVDFVQLAEPAQPAKQEWVKFLRRRYRDDLAALNEAWERNFAAWDDILALQERVPRGGAEDESAFLELIADRYFEITAQALKRYDPHHLTLGARYAGQAPAEVVRASARHVDVVSFNIYAAAPRVKLFLQYAREWDKPVLIGEFSFRGADSGLPNKLGAGSTVPTQRDRAEAYQYYVSTVLALPNIVGCHWFQYLDQPATGRFGGGVEGGENSNYGWANVRNEPYSDFVAGATLINDNVYFLRRHSVGLLQE